MSLRIARGLLTLASAVAANDLHFLVMGDWGGTDHSPWTHTAEVNTAKQMDKAAASLGAKFSLAAARCEPPAASYQLLATGTLFPSILLSTVLFPSILLSKCIIH